MVAVGGGGCASSVTVVEMNCPRSVCSPCARQGYVCSSQRRARAAGGHPGPLGGAASSGLGFVGMGAALVATSMAACSEQWQHELRSTVLTGVLAVTPPTPSCWL